MTTKDGHISRRVLVATAGALAAGAATAAPKAHRASADIRWDHEADIVCLGSGAAALTAGVVAHLNGDQVIIVEKQAVTGGTTAKSGAVHWIPNNRFLRAAGIDDQRTDALRYMVRFSFPNSYVADHATMGITTDEFALLEAFYDNGYAMVEHLEKMGVYKVMPWTFRDYGLLFNPETKPRATSTPDYLDHAPEDKVKSGRSLAMQRDDGGIASGADFIERLETFLAQRKQLILTKHRARELIQNKKGEVIGVMAESDGKCVYLRAKKAVILGTGGYAHNSQLVSNFQKTKIYGSCAGAGSEGDVIAMTSRVGGALGNMTSAWRADALIEQGIENHVLGAVIFAPAGDSMIYVNKHGKRYVNEYRSYNSRGKSHDNYDSTDEEYPNNVGVMIFDQRAVDIYGGAAPIPRPGEKSPWVIEAETLEQLTARIEDRLDRLKIHSVSAKLSDQFLQNLEQTISTFNRYARLGVDEEFGRGRNNFDRQIFNYISLPRNEQAAAGKRFLSNPTMFPLATKGPYFAVLIGMGVLDTNGGPIINSKAQVVDYDGNPIPGLYGAGNCIACPTREAYYGPGGTVGPAMTFGYIAANHAHAQPIKAPS